LAGGVLKYLRGGGEESIGIVEGYSRSVEEWRRVIIDS
jgi:hypothetical protein